jgi:hypothetical protein
MGFEEGNYNMDLKYKNNRGNINLKIRNDMNACV